eukprot:COSAG05_NODE_376_length_10629_cov_43.288319_10_plen_47_part_00
MFRAMFRAWSIHVCQKRKLQRKLAKKARQQEDRALRIAEQQAAAAL